MSKDLSQDKEAAKYKNNITNYEFILALLETFKKPSSYNKIAQKLNIFNKEQKIALRQLLKTMERDGKLVSTRHRLYILPKYCNFIRGKVTGHRDGYGFLCVKEQQDDFYLSSQQMKFCLHGDIILAQISNKYRKGRREAHFVRIITPRRSPIIGRYFTSKNNLNFVVPQDTRLCCKIIIPRSSDQSFNVHMGLVVVVEIIYRKSHLGKIFGKITEILGDKINTALAINIALRTNEIPYSWPEDVKKEISNICTKKVLHSICEDRIDIRHLPLITIDDEDAHDFDDAVYCEKKKNGWRLWVAIADVSYYVRPGSALDREAYQRGNSIYFPSQVVPMLPEILSNEICSLNTQVDRLCIVCEMTISHQGTLIRYNHYEAIMKSHGRLTYNIVGNILQKNALLCNKYSHLVKHVKNLYKLYQVLKIAREERGGIALEIESAKLILNADLRVEQIQRIIPNNAHKLIEECMILANIASSCFVKNSNEPMLFRDHDTPSKASIFNFQTLLKNVGLTLKEGGLKELQSVDYVSLLKKIACRPDAAVLQMMFLRSMKPAVYSPDNRGHFGLGLSCYAHFTSPIRRYPDLLLHRIIKFLLAKNKNSLIDSHTSEGGGYHYDIKQMRQFGYHCSMTERRAEEVTRDIIDWLKCDFFKNQVGNVFNGIIYSVTSFGFFVRLKDLFIDGLVHISKLNKDYYHFDSISQCLVAESSGITYTLGDMVKVRVDTVCIDARKINFLLVDSDNRKKNIKNDTPQKSKRDINKIYIKGLQNVYKTSNNM